MSEVRDMRCPECGGAVKPVAKSGRTTPYLNMPNLELPAEIEIPTCEQCGEEFISPTLAEKLDEQCFINLIKEIK